MILGAALVCVLALTGWAFLPGSWLAQQVAFLTGDAGAGSVNGVTSDLSGNAAVPEAATEAEVFYNRGLHYILREEETARSVDDSIHMFHRAIEHDPEYAVAWAMLGEAFWRRHLRGGRDAASRDEAIKAVDEAFRLDPDLAEAHHARGYGFIIQGDFESAEGELKSAVAKDPRFDRAWAMLGHVYRKLGEYQSGLQALQKAVELKPDDFRHHIRLGNFYGVFSEYDAATVAYRDALALKPDSVMAWNNLGGMLLKMDDVAEALIAFQRALEIEETASARSNLGTGYVFMENYEKAVKNYQRATEIEPENSTHWSNLGDALKMLDRTVDSLAAYQQAVAFARVKAEQTPGDPQAHSRLGLNCAQIGDTECALVEGRKAAELAPQNSETIFRVAVMYYLAGRQDEALDWLEKAVRLGCSKAEIENDPDLAGLREDPRYLRILGLAS